MTLALITGGSGLVGSNLTRALLDDGYKVRCLDFHIDHLDDIELILSYYFHSMGSITSFLFL